MTSMEARQPVLDACGKHPEEVSRAVQEMAAVVADLLAATTRAMTTSDAAFARRVLIGEADVDWWESTLHDLCVKRLASADLTAQERQRLSAALRLAKGLERVADLAVRVSEQALDLHRSETCDVPSELLQAAEVAQAAVRDAARGFFASPDCNTTRCGRSRDAVRMPMRAAAEVLARVPDDPRGFRRTVQMHALTQLVQMLLDCALDLPQFSAESAAPSAGAP